MKNVLITGGSRGIGAEMVRAFSRAGYRVAFTYLSSKESAEKLAGECSALAFRADSGSEAEVDSVLSLAKEKIGNIDVLINNSGVSSIMPLSMISLEEWKRVFDASVTGAFLYSKGVLSQMLEKKQGRIINITSIWGLVGASCEVHYSAAKAALIGFTKALAKELGPSGITVNAIAPGVINTEMNKSLDETMLDVLKEETPIGRLGEPSEIARAALFLASEDSGFITGEVLNISGGFVV